MIGREDRAVHSQQDFVHLGDHLVLERAFETRICRTVRKSRMSTFAGQGSSMPSWLVLESRAHAVAGWNSSAT